MTKDVSESGATRNKIENYRFDLIEWEFIDQMAKVMGEGAVSHGEANWKQGFDNLGRDVDNHIFEHYRKYRIGDPSEPHLAKMAIGLMFLDFFDRKKRTGIKCECADENRCCKVHRGPLKVMKNENHSEAS